MRKCVGIPEWAATGVAVAAMLFAGVLSLTSAARAADDCDAIAGRNKTEYRDARLSVRESRLTVKSLNSQIILRTAELEEVNGGLRLLVGEFQARGGVLFFPPVPETAHFLVQIRPVTRDIVVHHYRQLAIYDQQMTHYRLMKDYIRNYMERMEGWKESCPGMSVGNAWEWSGKQGNSIDRAIKRTHRLIDLVDKRIDWLRRLSAWAQESVPEAQ